MIWKRYFLAELLKVCALFMGCFYFLYVLVDYSVHTKVFQSDQISFTNIIVYYICQFTKRADILIPIALMVATIKVLCTSNIRLEIVALATGGISFKKILHPFLWTAIACASLLYLNSQFLQPYSLKWITHFEERFFKGRNKENENKQVNALQLKDGSLLLYQHFDAEKQAFFDLFWIKTFDQIYRINSLFPYEKSPKAEYVDLLVRAPSGEIMKTASFETLSLPEIKFEEKILFSVVHPPRMQSLSQLAHGLEWNHLFSKMNDYAAETATFFYFRLTLPLICLLAVIGPAPFCLRFSRSIPVFMIYSLSLFGMLTFFTCMNSFIILGASQVIPPLLAILLPQTPFFLILIWKYAKL